MNAKKTFFLIFASILDDKDVMDFNKLPKDCESEIEVY